jgi:hypothetical protein
MNSTMSACLGYDNMGNNPRLLCEADRKKLESGEYFRVAGDAICTHCKCPFSLHPAVQGALWLNRACDGDLVKL